MLQKSQDSKITLFNIFNHKPTIDCTINLQDEFESNQHRNFKLHFSIPSFNHISTLINLKHTIDPRNRGSQHLWSIISSTEKSIVQKSLPRTNLFSSPQQATTTVISSCISARTRVLLPTISSPVIPQDKGLRRVVDGLINFERESWPRVRNPDTPRTEEGRRGKRNWRDKERERERERRREEKYREERKEGNEGNWSDYGGSGARWNALRIRKQMPLDLTGSRRTITRTPLQPKSDMATCSDATR